MCKRNDPKRLAKLQFTQPVWVESAVWTTPTQLGTPIHATHMGCNTRIRTTTYALLLQSMQPVWVATYHMWLIVKCYIYFNPRNPCRLQLTPLMLYSYNFNPRNPHWLQQGLLTTIINIRTTSIHATPWLNMSFIKSCNFNPLNPCELRPVPVNTETVCILLQSTQPMRVETLSI